MVVATRHQDRPSGRAMPTHSLDSGFFVSITLVHVPSNSQVQGSATLAPCQVPQRFFVNHTDRRPSYKWSHLPVRAFCYPRISWSCEIISHLTQESFKRSYSNSTQNGHDHLSYQGFSSTLQEDTRHHRAGSKSRSSSFPIDIRQATPQHTSKHSTEGEGSQSGTASQQDRNTQFKAWRSHRLLSSGSQQEVDSNIRFLVLRGNFSPVRMVRFVGTPFKCVQDGHRDAHTRATALVCSKVGRAVWGHLAQAVRTGAVLGNSEVNIGGRSSFAVLMVNSGAASTRGPAVAVQAQR